MRGPVDVQELEAALVAVLAADPAYTPWSKLTLAQRGRCLAQAAAIVAAYLARIEAPAPARRSAPPPAAAPQGALL